MIKQLFMEKHKFKLLMAVLFLALAVRISVFPAVFSNGSITFLGADTYYHVRRILYTVSHFPDAISFDSYIDFPFGSKIGWMPLYDQFIALVALIIGFGKPSAYTVEAVAAVVPPLLGVLAVLVVFFIAETLFDWKVGLISAGIFAITPAYVYVSFLGYPDHHVAETLLSTAAYLFFIIAMKRSQKENIPIALRMDILKRSQFAVLTGIMLALSIFTWNGAPIFVGLIGVFILIQFVFNMYSGRSSDYLVMTGGIAFFIALLIIAPAALTRDGFNTDSYLPSLFHAEFLLLFFLLCVLLAIMQKMNFKKWWSHPVLLALIFAVMLVLIEFLSPKFYQSASESIVYLFGGGILATIQEASPLFFQPGIGFSFSNVWNAFALSFFIALPALVYFIKKTVKEKYPPEAMFLVVWTLVVLALTVLQRRFIYLLAVNIAIFSAYFINRVQGAFPSGRKTVITKKKRKLPKSSDPAPSAAAHTGLVIGSLLIILLAVPDLVIIKSMAVDNIVVPANDLQESFKWLKGNTPPTSYYNSPDKPAEYGVMSWWDYGNWILYFSERPVVANNFQTGIEDAANFLIGSDEGNVNDILNRRKVRFVITDAQMLKLKFRSIAALAGRNPDDYYGAKEPSEEAQIRSVNSENKNFFATMLSRLHVFDGDGLSSYRLIYESKTTAIRNPDIKYVKIFEYVPGAAISGKTSVDGEVKATLYITTNQGRTFTYTGHTTAEGGKYVIRVPYPTLGSKYGTVPAGDYIIQNANTSRSIQVREEDVMEGREIQVDLVQNG
ncbi:MAG: oligosaccharyl transferase, archaeosortase A system-associated [Candidatus Methanoperedens sp.]|nr:oligosaccharyl transferase, archaeosortase A system-associated [Candidatus Methanoperedens sp.]